MFDFGIIVMPRPFEGLPGLFTLSALDDAALQRVRSHRVLHIAGFPGDKPLGTMWQHAERLDLIGPQALHYSVDTCPGHSGSPVWVQRDRDRPVEVIAVHVAGPTPHAEGAWGCRPGVPVAPAGSFNRGIRLSNELIGMTRDAGRGRGHAQLMPLHRGP